LNQRAEHCGRQPRSQLHLRESWLVVELELRLVANLMPPSPR
jgi:hypothetical protein